MHRIIKKTFIIPLISLTVLSPKASAVDLFGRACDKAQRTSSICKQVSGQTSNPVLNLINTTVEIIVFITGALAVVMIIFGGITMITSAGNPEAVANARKRIIYSVVGVAVVALAWLIISFTTTRLIK
jgi:hypothetical protein